MIPAMRQTLPLAALALFAVGSVLAEDASLAAVTPDRATALGHNIHRYKLVVFIVAAVYAGFGGGLLKSV